MFCNAYCIMEPGGCSDHLRGHLHLGLNAEKKKGPFKFSNAIVAHPDFLQKVENFWNQSTALFHSTYALFLLSRKLKQLKPVIRELSRDNLANISIKHQKPTKICVNAIELLFLHHLVRLFESKLLNLRDGKR